MIQETEQHVHLLKGGTTLVQKILYLAWELRQPSLTSHMS